MAINTVTLRYHTLTKLVLDPDSPRTSSSLLAENCSKSPKLPIEVELPGPASTKVRARGGTEERGATLCSSENEEESLCLERSSLRTVEPVAPLPPVGSL